MSRPHQDQPLRTAGTELESAEAALVLVHGRGATARSILELGREVAQEGVALLAPQAAGNTWYPNSFLAPLESNEPGLSSGLRAVGKAVESANSADIPPERVALLGFSQGACLASEYVVRNPRRYGALVALSGGLIGPEGAEFDYDRSLDGTPAFVGCSDHDPHIPLERVHETTAALERMDADVTERIYEGMGHEVNRDELDHVRDIVDGLME